MHSLRNISLAFGGPLLLDGINLQLEAGDRLCLMGRNGTGKSTLMKLISGELFPTAGKSPASRACGWRWFPRKSRRGWPGRSSTW